MPPRESSKKDVKVLLVCQDEADQKAYLKALDPFGIQIDIIESPARLFTKMTATAYNGLLVDLKTKVKASDRAKAVIHDAVDQIPVVQLKWDPKNGQVRSFHFGRSKAAGTLESFIEEECRQFEARPLRRSARRPAHFNIELDRTGRDPRGGATLTVTVNVSIGGCFVYTIDDYEIDSEITMVMKELKDQTPVQGIVRWRRPWGEGMQIPGIGVQLGDMPPAQLEDFSAKAKLPESQAD